MCILNVVVNERQPQRWAQVVEWMGRLNANTAAGDVSKWLTSFTSGKALQSGGLPAPGVNTHHQNISRIGRASSSSSSASGGGKGGSSGNGENNAVLVFLPGIKEITTVGFMCVYVCVELFSSSALTFIFGLLRVAEHSNFYFFLHSFIMLSNTRVLTLTYLLSTCLSPLCLHSAATRCAKCSCRCRRFGPSRPRAGCCRCTPPCRPKTKGNASRNPLRGPAKSCSPPTCKG